MIDHIYHRGACGKSPGDSGLPKQDRLDWPTAVTEGFLEAVPFEPFWNGCESAVLGRGDPSCVLSPDLEARCIAPFSCPQRIFTQEGRSCHLKPTSHQQDLAVLIPEASAPTRPLPTGLPDPSPEASPPLPPPTLDLGCSLQCHFAFLFIAQFNSVAQSCPTLCYPMDYSMPGLRVHRQLPECTQTHVR